MACKQHINHSIKWKGEVLGIAEMKRHYSNYFKGIPNFKDLRIQLVTSNIPDEIFHTLDQIKVRYGDKII